MGQLSVPSTHFDSLGLDESLAKMMCFLNKIAKVVPVNEMIKITPNRVILP